MDLEKTLLGNTKVVYHSPMSESKTQKLHYGTHLLLLLSSVANGSTLDRPEELCDFLTALIQAIGMRILDGPRTVTEVTENDQYGHSVVVILYESHAAVHSYPTRRSLFLDLFSCKSFKYQDVIAICHSYFGSFEISEHLVLNRGVNWHGSVKMNTRKLTKRDS